MAARAVALSLLCLTASQAFADSMAAGIGTTVSGLEWHLERAERCRKRAEALQRRLERLRADPLSTEAAIADAEQRLLTSQQCMQWSSSRASTLELTLASLRKKFLESTRADATVLAAKIDALRAVEHERAVIDLDIRALQVQINALRKAEPVNIVVLAQKVAVQEGLRSALLAVVERIADANQALADLEASSLALLGGRGATLNWSTPTTREDGSPLAVGELGGYEVYMLAESTGQTRVFTVDDPMTTTYTVGGLTPDTYHFSISAYDINGVFSPLSPVVAKTVR